MEVESQRLGVNGFVQTQRSRIIAATIEALGSHAAPCDLTVSTVTAHARVSRRTFYELFPSCEECLLAAIDYALERAGEHLHAAIRPSASWQARMRSGVQALLSFSEENPQMAWLLVVQSLAAGSRAVERRTSALRRVIEEIDRGREVARTPAGLSPLTAEGLAGGVLAVLHSRMCERPEDSLIALTSPLTSMIVLPYLGASAARRELARPAPKRPADGRPPSAAVRLNDLGMRLTYRTVRVLTAIAERPGASNRQIGSRAGVLDQGQISKLLRRLQRFGLIENSVSFPREGPANAWTLTATGRELQVALGLHGATSAGPGRDDVALVGPS